MPKPLTLTSHAILSLIAIKPFTTYALAREMERSVGFICPRAPSQIYEEPKRLVRLGLATSRRERTGQRFRTVYRITAKGREALRDWHNSPSIAEPSLESEALLRIFFSDHSTPERMRAAIDSLLAYADRIDETGADVGNLFFNDPQRFGDRGPFAALIHSFLIQYARFLRDWSETAKREVGRWRDVAPAGKKAWMERTIARPRAAQTGKRTERTGRSSNQRASR
ncbi:MAG: hypothetical protein A4S14_20590 [Proteobacteria bacterium SG_bin9]|nr:MAG: hypothetical protein A4S14_20590 [Proteobacteria bacterium SG_bin9]